MPEKFPIPRSSKTAWPQLTVAAVFAVLAFAQGGFYPPAFASIAIATWLAIGALALRPSDARGALPAPALAVVLVGAALVAWTGLSLAWASDRGAGYEDLVRGLAYLGIFLVLILWRAQGRLCLRALAIGGGTVVVVALLSRLLGLGDDGFAVELPAAAGRLSFPLGYWNALGLLAAVVATLSVWLAGASRQRWGMAAAGLLPICGSVILLTGSRGALVAATVGAATAVSFSQRRRWALAALLLAAVTSVPGLVAMAAIGEIRTGTLGAFAPTGLVVVLLIAAAAAATARHHRRLAPRIGRPSFRPTRVQIGALIAILGGLVILVGPGVLTGDLGAGDPAPEVSPGQSALTSGSGRSAFWSVALEAFAEEPVRGLGAGGYENWWNANGELPVSIENAHSAPIETLAELGLVGFLLLIAIAVVVVGTAVRCLRIADPETRETVGAALAVVLVVAIGSSLDWIYEVPAAFVGGVVAAAVICGEPAPRFPRSRRAEVGASTSRWRLALVPVAAASVVAAAALAVGSSQLELSEDAFERGDLVEAARAARTASRFIPWSAEPELVVAEIESLAGNVDAATLGAEEAIRKNPADYRGWLLLAVVRLQLGDREAAEAYSTRAVDLARQVLPRAVVELRSRPAPG